MYNKGEEDFRNLLELEELDAVIISTPWEWYGEMSVAAMKAGKHVGIEVPATITIEDCWALVEASEETGRFCMMLENICYYRYAMAVLNMVRKGIFGDLTHLQGAYQHDLMDVKLNDGKQAYSGGIWGKGLQRCQMADTACH